MPVYFGQNLILLDKLASGGMGEVFRARQTGTGGFQKTVAVKRILPQFAARADFAEMFRHEMNLCARLQHPNIVQVFSNGKESGYLYLVMEFVKGRTVAELLVTSRKMKIRIPPEVSCFIISEVAQGLAYAHALMDEQSGKPLEIVHRDVSPQNIMLGTQGEVKILDFGIARAADRVEGTRTGDLKGKVPYAAPEYIEGRLLDSRADIFGLGVVFHELLAQRPLFAAESTVQTLQNVVEMPIPSLIEEFPDIRFELEGIVMRALERDPEYRYQDAQEMYKNIAVFTNKMYPSFTRSGFTKFVNDLFTDESDPAMAELRDLYGYSKKVPIDLVESDTGTVPSENPEEQKAGGHFEYSTFPRVLFLIPVAILLIAVGIAAWLLRKDEVEEIKPTEISGLLSFYQPGSFEQSLNGRVLRWKDSGWLKTDIIQQVQALQPSVLKGELNGYDVLHFSGQEYFTSPEIASTLSRIQSLSIVYVVRNTETSGDSASYVWSAYGVDKILDVLRGGFIHGDKVRLKYARDPGVVLFDDAKNIAPGSWSIYSTVFSDVKAEFFQNGKQIISSPIRVPIRYSDIDIFSVGQAYEKGEPAGFFRGDIAEFISYTRDLNLRERKALERALAVKYRIQIEE